MGYIDENGDWIDIGDETGGGYNANLDTGTSPNPGAPGGGYDPRVDPGIPSVGNTYGGGGDTFGNNPNGWIQAILGAGGARGGAAGLPGGGSLSSLLSSLGLSNGGLLPLLGGALGAYLNHGATQKATDQMVAGLHDASTQATNQIGGAQANILPFITAGQNAVGKAGAMTWNQLAPQYKPLGSGRSLSSFMGK